MISNALTIVRFNSTILESSDIEIRRDPFNTGAFRVGKDGLYKIGCSWAVTLNDPPVTAVSYAAIHLYKNGVAYSELDYKPMFVNYVLDDNYHFPKMRLNGFDSIYLERADRIDIIFEFLSITVPPTNLGLTDIHNGYVNIIYDNNRKI
jgi:hypothetical protein